MKNQIKWLGLLVAAALSTSLGARAQAPEPGSMLVMPEFDNRIGVFNALTITNTSEWSSISVEFVYIDKESCEEFNRTVEMTPNDTLTVLTKFHNPDHIQGFVYMFAKNAAGEPIAFDHLIGNNLVIDGLAQFQYATNPFVFQAGSGLAEGDLTDLEAPGDGVRDMDGNEYEQAPDVIMIPRFFGQDSLFHSELILIGLTGGASFSTTVDLLIYNDNEEEFSAEATFTCWDKVSLLDISGIFSNEFLSYWTNHDQDEILGVNYIETGWMRIDGGVASSSALSIPNPAVLAVLVESLGLVGVADLPFKTGTQDNGDLLPRGILGDQAGGGSGGGSKRE